MIKSTEMQQIVHISANAVGKIIHVYTCNFK